MQKEISSPLTYAIITVATLLMIGLGLFAINREPVKRLGAHGGPLVGQVSTGPKTASR